MTEQQKEKLILCFKIFIEKLCELSVIYQMSSTENENIYSNRKECTITAINFFNSLKFKISKLINVINLNQNEDIKHKTEQYWSSFNRTLDRLIMLEFSAEVQNRPLALYDQAVADLRSSCEKLLAKTADELSIYILGKIHDIKRSHDYSTEELNNIEEVISDTDTEDDLQINIHDDMSETKEVTLRRCRI